MIRALLVDDEAPARARLRALLDEIGGVTVVGEAGDADAARAAVAALAPDVVFLDIEMPAERGTDLAATLPEPRPFIVFATAYERFAVDAFQYDAADYLLKPVNRQRLQATLQRMRDKLAQRRASAREVEAATRAQAYLLPQSLPQVPGYVLAARTLAARAVGGDFYDAVVAADHLAFVLGDVAGKGMAAGLVASSVQARWQAAMRQLRSHPDRHDDGPERRRPALDRGLPLRHARARGARAGHRAAPLRQRRASTVARRRRRRQLAHRPRGHGAGARALRRRGVSRRRRRRWRRAIPWS